MLTPLKGACGFLGLQQTAGPGRADENLLSKLVFTPEISSALLATVDGIRQMLGAISTSGQDGEESFHDVIETLTHLQKKDRRVKHNHSPI